MYFSDRFEIDPKVLEDNGAINISLICDIPLFIDPMLIFASDKDEYQRLHKEIIKYFLYLEDQSKKPDSQHLLMYLFGFPEIKNNWLGYSKRGMAVAETG